MDESYLRFARSLVILGEVFEATCRAAASTSPKVGRVQARADQLVLFGHALVQSAPALTLHPLSQKALVAATLRLDEARLQLAGTRLLSPNQLRAAAFTVNAVLTDVLPGLPDLPDLPKPQPIPPDDLVDVVIGGRKGRSGEEERG